jgi:ribosome maturation factor RimP
VQGTVETVGDSAERVAELARAEASARGLAVLEVDVRPGRPAVVTVTVDLDVPDHGRLTAGEPPREAVDIDVIAALSRALDAALADSGLVGDDATLEVSSPGVERPLVSPQDLVRNLGRDVELPVDGSAVRGRLVAVENGNAVIVMDGTEHQIALDRIGSARLVLPW